MSSFNFWELLSKRPDEEDTRIPGTKKRTRETTKGSRTPTLRGFQGIGSDNDSDNERAGGEMDGQRTGDGTGTAERPLKKLRGATMAVPMQMPVLTPVKTLDEDMDRKPKSTPNHSKNKKNSSSCSHQGKSAPQPPTSVTTQQQQQDSDLLRMLPEEVLHHALGFVGSRTDRFSLQVACKTFRRISNADDMLAKIRLGDSESDKGIILGDDTPGTATAALTPFARAGNLEAVYM